MARRELSMRKIREILRLKHEGEHSNRTIARSLNISRSSVSECLKRFTKQNLTWPLPEELDDEQLEQKIYPPVNRVKPIDKGEVDWAKIHQELKRKHVTLALLWQEYKRDYPNGISYSMFCLSHREFGKKLDVWMRQSHKAGEKLFVDYAGDTVPVLWDSRTGETRAAQIFIAVLGASNYFYVEATWTQNLADWIGAHVRAFEFLGGVPELIVPDNLRSGIHKAHRYEPDLNPSYQDMASYYGVAILPARVATPKDKAKVEQAVLHVERQILARLRNQTFLSLHQLNQALKELRDELNQRPFQKLPGSRKTQFDELERPLLKSLPVSRYVFAEWKKVRAGADYHIELEQHYYSVPYTFSKKSLDARFSQNTVEIFYKGKCIALHRRSYARYQHTTLHEHMPKSHQAYAEWTPQRIVQWAEKMGTCTAQLVEKIIAAKAHPQQGFRACLGILRLAKTFGQERLEAACHRAMVIGATSYKSVESILKNGLDQKPLPQQHAGSSSSPTQQPHENIRGKNYFE
jgi:transposase